MKRLICVAALGAAAVLAQAADVALEAELGAIEAPMVVAVPSDAAAEGGPEPDEPSRGKFVWVAGPPASGGNDHVGWVSFDFSVEKAGDYAIWGRIVAWDGNSDSFWVKIEGADPDEQPQESQNTHFRWSTSKNNNWHWDRVNQWLDGGTFARAWELTAGDHTLIIYSRESAAMLDTVFITDNLSEEEADVPLRAPTDEDVAIQTGQPTNVEPQGKLAAVWAELKR